MFSPQNHIGVLDSVLYSVLGFAIVFAMLILLMVMIHIVSGIMERSTKNTAEPGSGVAPVAYPPTATVPSAAAQKELLLSGTSEKEAALIMAIVASEMGKPLDQLRFHYIKEVSKQ